MPHRCARVLPPTEIVALPDEFPATLLLLIHTEEEFDWTQPFDRQATSTRGVDALDGAHALFSEQGVKPTYVVDWPVIQRTDSGSRFGRWCRDGTAEIGAHLHPWVNPPHEEEVDEWHSFAGNLGPDLERRKLVALTEAITERVGERPRTYLAGRYGIGAVTPVLLQELGYEVDASATPPFDFRSQGGPDFRRFPSRPFRWRGAPDLLALPISGAYHGFLESTGPVVYPFLQSAVGRALKLEGLVSRTGILTRARLSPEGFELVDLIRLTRALWARGVRIFTLSLHSTTFTPGCTMYVNSEAELRAFSDRCRAYIDWFREEFGGRPASHLDVARELRGRRGSERPVRTTVH
ncbi:MAG: hypothetical protein AAFZ65_12525 [Planctomycetota bacterium]